MASDELSGLGNVLLWILQHMGRPVVRSAHLHGAELMQLEVLLVLAYALLGEEYRARVINEYPYCQKQKNRG